MRLLDTNLLIRYLTADDSIKAQAVASLLQSVKAGRVHLYTTEVVVAEVTFVLSSPKGYHLSNSDIVARLSPILRLRGISIPRKRVVPWPSSGNSVRLIFPMRCWLLLQSRPVLPRSSALILTLMGSAGLPERNHDSVVCCTQDQCTA